MIRITGAILVFLISMAVISGLSQANAQMDTNYALSATPVWTLPDGFLKEDEPGGELGWPEVGPEARPGAYWWWPGGAVTKRDLTWNLETYQKAGWGNMGVVGIYGVKGEEDRFIDIFSTDWFNMFNHAVNEAERLGMNIDLTPSSGWRLGGPHITGQFAEESFSVIDGKISPVQLDIVVERAGPGGEGLCINPYSLSAIKVHFNWLSDRFEEGAGLFPRAFYYDSFENEGNWCPEFLESFKKLRGYNLEDHVDALDGKGDPAEIKRVISDYRETLSDLLIECVEYIARWGEARGSNLRMQAHGAPANLLDMYAAASIPETEVFGANQFDIPGYRRDPALSNPETPDILVNRFASSAAHVAGHKLVIAESFTWLRNHYHTALSHIKAESDQLLLNGINGIYYHGLCYSPRDADWPGWLFYASTQANYRNSIFRDIPALNEYITRCQSVLQQGQPDNDVLLYWPVYDLWMSGGSKEMRFRVHQPRWLKESACGEAAQWMVDQGYTFDYISDKQIKSIKVENDALITGGKGSYRTLLVPATRHMEISTLKHLVKLAGEGATILFWKEMPVDVPGWHEYISRKKELSSILEGTPFDTDNKLVIGNGQMFMDDDLEKLLDLATVSAEPMVREGLQFTRRKLGDQTVYFLANHSARRIDGWIELASSCQSARIMDPMTGRAGMASIKHTSGKPEIYLQMEPGESRVLRLFSQEMLQSKAWPILRPVGEPLEVKGIWDIEFVEGGPFLPGPMQDRKLTSWTNFDRQHVNSFAGAARYTIDIDLPSEDANHWILDLGDVRESARVWVNHKPAGVLVAHPFRLDISEFLKVGLNEVSIEVTNLSANRIRDLDTRGIEWRKFYDINFVSHLYKPFDASVWPLKASGLLGPVMLIPVQITNL